MLSWHNCGETRQKAILSIMQAVDFDYTALILPQGRKDCWEECATVLCTLNNEKILDLLPNLLVWLKDMNWPGADAIFSRLKQIPYNTLCQAIKLAIAEAKKINDEEWINNLQLLNSLGTADGSGRVRE